MIFRFRILSPKIVSRLDRLFEGVCSHRVSYSISAVARILAVALPFCAAHGATAINDPPPPSIPARTFAVTSFGGIGDGRTMNTAAFAKAINACAAAGGGSVIVPPGVFLTGPIRLASHMALVVEKGGTIQASNKFSDFGLPDPLPATQAELNKLRDSLQSLISGSDLTDVAIRGEGTIDGAGGPWWAKSDRAARDYGGTYVPRPNMIVIRRCARLEVSGVTLSNSPQFHLVPQLCTDVLVDGVKIHAPSDSPNTDAIDPSNCRAMLIRHVLTDSGDDNIAFKANRDGPTENITVTDCTFLHGHGVSIGSETTGGVRNILVQRCTFENTGTAIRIKSARDRGGVIEDITYRDITMKNVETAIYINLFYDDKTQARYPQSKPVTGETPMVRNILISNITCENARSAGEITALPEAFATNVTLDNVRITAWTGFSIQDAQGLEFKNVSITTSPRPIEPLVAADSPKAPGPPRPSPCTPAQTEAVKRGAVTVAADGAGDFKTVQAAVDAAPDAATAPSPFLIHIKPGIYHEVVTIPPAKAPIHLEGEDAANTTITSANAATTLDAAGHPLGTFKSATVSIESDDFSADNITFENSFGKGSQALALGIGGDRAAFRKCRFIGWQDTLLLRQGRQYFEDCTITGAADFIFGAGAALFQRCQIHCVGSGYITAASTPQEHAFGFVFYNCTIAADPGLTTYLGRPWRPFASVAFLATLMPGAIHPEGWQNWDHTENYKTARYAEWKSAGPGANPEMRVPWSKQLTDGQARAITLDQVLGGWSPNGSSGKYYSSENEGPTPSGR
jgi:pectin methylesterase-like acyl-CoA thioesterase